MTQLEEDGQKKCGGVFHFTLWKSAIADNGVKYSIHERQEVDAIKMAFLETRTVAAVKSKRH